MKRVRDVGSSGDEESVGKMEKAGDAEYQVESDRHKEHPGSRCNTIGHNL
jgi:hypothetical protein